MAGYVDNHDGALIEIWPHSDDEDECVHLDCRHDVHANLDALKPFRAMPGCIISPTGWFVLDQYLGEADDYEYDAAGRMLAD